MYASVSPLASMTRPEPDAAQDGLEVVGWRVEWDREQDDSMRGITRRYFFFTKMIRGPLGQIHMGKCEHGKSATYAEAKLKALAWWRGDSACDFEAELGGLVYEREARA